MELYFIRHAIAVDRADAGVRSDAERWLTEEGLQKMERAAKGLKAIVSGFNVIYTSPYVRARQTAGIIARQYENENLISETPELEPGGDFRSLVALVTPQPPNARIALVGHEPDLSEWISLLVTGSPDAEIQMKKGAVCRVDLNGKPVRGSGVLVWLLQPAHLRRLE
ncbi:MAG TPA: phosphohistidine phosphatase SixA [bacterium]|nr:phosphohistidine phosphatase SixA [Candidatus Omnitrophota bacterium]HOJ62709.1 phosphohistidine phosphatase SixA [bacterium]HOL95664.1 phosphohistidine phosphatase SixA [bacterium]HPP01025.1 phosphohistidine phosphatase SixA [bacterium]HXK94352.1 phosphohistidine phosphatase SixA [bacterium]